MKHTISLFPAFRSQRDATREQRQREWLRTHDIVVVQKWQWPSQTFLQRRLAEIAKVRAEEAKT